MIDNLQNDAPSNLENVDAETMDHEVHDDLPGLFFPDHVNVVNHDSAQNEQRDCNDPNKPDPVNDSYEDKTDDSDQEELTQEEINEISEQDMKIEQRHMEPINMNNVADTGFEILWQCLAIHKIKIMQQLDSFC